MFYTLLQQIAGVECEDVLACDAHHRAPHRRQDEAPRLPGPQDIAVPESRRAAWLDCRPGQPPFRMRERAFREALGLIVRCARGLRAESFEACERHLNNPAEWHLNNSAEYKALRQWGNPRLRRQLRHCRRRGQSVASRRVTLALS